MDEVTLCEKHFQSTVNSFKITKKERQQIDRRFSFNCCRRCEYIENDKNCEESGTKIVYFKRTDPESSFKDFDLEIGLGKVTDKVRERILFVGGVTWDEEGYQAYLQDLKPFFREKVRIKLC